LTYVAGEPGTQFFIKITVPMGVAAVQRTGNRIAVALSVDGLNPVNKLTARTSGPLLVVENGRLDIHGFGASQESPFRFSEPSERDDCIGIIGATFWGEAGYHDDIVSHRARAALSEADPGALRLLSPAIRHAEFKPGHLIGKCYIHYDTRKALEDAGIIPPTPLGFLRRAFPGDDQAA
jgi:hypothetical protein